MSSERAALNYLTISPVLYPSILLLSEFLTVISWRSFFLTFFIPFSSFFLPLIIKCFIMNIKTPQFSDDLRLEMWLSFCSLQDLLQGVGPVRSSFSIAVATLKLHSSKTSLHTTLSLFLHVSLLLVVSYPLPSAVWDFSCLQIPYLVEKANPIKGMTWGGGDFLHFHRRGGDFLCTH